MYGLEHLGVWCAVETAYMNMKEIERIRENSSDPKHKEFLKLIERTLEEAKTPWKNT